MTGGGIEGGCFGPRGLVGAVGLGAVWLWMSTLGWVDDVQLSCEFLMLSRVAISKSFANVHVVVVGYRTGKISGYRLDHVVHFRDVLGT